MRRSARSVAAAAAALAWLAPSSPARAQPIDTAPPLPNVMLLLDTSGSMEKMIDGSNPEDPQNNPMPGLTYGAACTGQPSAPNRWGIAIQALTGDFNTYACVDMKRNSGTAFDAEFSMNGNHPYDVGYYLDYHRPVQPIDNTYVCAFGHDGSSTGWPAKATPSPPQVNSDFAAAALGPYKMTYATQAYTPSSANACTFPQSSNGMLDSALNMMRFGLMTFDNDNDALVGTAGYPSVGTGVSVSNTSPLTFTNLSNPFFGEWSYYSGWDSNSAAGATHGRPAGCTTDPFFELGARNPAAPPWEGRMIRFPDPSTPSQLGVVNDQIQRAILAMRPYGANPIAAMLDDAKYYYWLDPQGPNGNPGDAYVKGGCRTNYVILFTHAAPNMDLMPYCTGAGGKCPYDLPENIALGLAQGTYSPTAGLVPNVQSAAASGPKVLTFVVGFSMSTFTRPDGSPGKCSDVVNPDGSINTSLCNSTDVNVKKTYGACCTLEKIAINGGTGSAYFADTKGDLNTALGSIIAQIAKQITTRVPPVASAENGTVTTTGGSSSAVFVSSFSPSPAVPWKGDVQRERLTCDRSTGSYSPQIQSVDPSKGDDFASNIDQDQSTARKVLVVEPYKGGALARNATATIRPWMKGPGSPSPSGAGFDNLTLYDGIEYMYAYTGGQAGAVVDTSQITPDALNVTSCPITIPGTPAPGTAFDANSCETIAFNFALGLKNGPSTWPTAVQPFPGRFYNPSDPIQFQKSAFGDIYHSVPAVVGPPSSSVSDESYQQFAAKFTAQYRSDGKPRPTMLYVATNDGLLHGFFTDYDPRDGSPLNTKRDNELWSIIPPAVLPKLIGSFPSSHQIMLDGAPVVKDTVFDRTGPSSATDWHTTLVASFGAGGPGYYAVDVTDPDISHRTSAEVDPSHGSTNSGATAYAQTSGPHFLWQLADPVLFGAVGATPAITTVFTDPGDGGGAREIGVAILPGGGPSAPASSTNACPRSPNTAITGTTDKRIAATPVGTTWANTMKVRQWGSSCTAAVPGRSLSVVRLDTGEVIRTFVRADPSYEPSVDVPSATWSLLTASPSQIGTNAAGYRYSGRVIDTPLDSPMTGTPVVYPADVGTLAQKVYVADADGTVWRFDLSSKNANEWFGEVYLDSFNVKAASASGFTSDANWGTAARQGLTFAPVISTGRDGNLVLNFATGDLNNLGIVNSPAYPNLAYSTSEVSQTDSNTGKTRLRAQVNWVQVLAGNEMVTGPMAVFDGAWYFTTYQPPATSSTCAFGMGRLWGMDFANADPANAPTSGGMARLPLPNNPSTFAQEIDQGNFVIPGVAVTSTLSCSTATSGSDQYVAGASHLTASNVTQAQYSITMVGGKPKSGSGSTISGNTVPTDFSFAVRTPSSATVVDSWAAVVE